MEDIKAGDFEKNMDNTVNTIDDYILQFPSEIQEKLRELRQTIKEAAPDATEKISWQMPTFVLYGNLVHFAVHKNHIGFYPAPEGIEAFMDRFTELKYKSSKGAVQFPMNQPLPLDLIREIVRFRVAGNIKAEEYKQSKGSNKSGK